jgi:hypothetical protein
VLPNAVENLTAENLVVAETLVPEAPAPVPLYAFRERDKYGYIAAVSEDDRKRGKAAGDVVLFVYRGHDGNLYKIDSVTTDGRVTVDYECERPCAALKQYTYSGVGYIAFEPTSLIGAAFTDAFNGFLGASPLPKPKPPISTGPWENYSTPATTSNTADPIYTNIAVGSGNEVNNVD